MKAILFFLLFMPLAAGATGVTYAYSKVNLIQNGSDSFTLPEYSSAENPGTIVIRGSNMTIDDRTYRLKPTRKPNVYRIRGGMARFVFKSRKLVAVQLCRYNQLQQYSVEGRMP